MISLPLMLALMTSSSTLEDSLKNGDFKAQINGTTIAYRVAGKGPPCMVLTNSWGFTGAGLQKMFGALEKSLTMIYFDPRGMGGSGPIEKPEDLGMATVRADMNALREHLGLEKTHFLGWSNGAMNGLFYVSQYDQYIDRAVFMHGLADLEPHPLDAQKRKQDAEFYKHQGRFLGQLRQSDLSEDEKNKKLGDFIINTWFPRLFMDIEVGQATLNKLYKDQAFSLDHLLHQFTVDMAGFDARPAIAKIKSPCLIIAGTHDAAHPQKVKEIHEAIAGSQFAEFKESGHFSSLEEPERFLKVMTAFFFDDAQ